MNRRRKSPFPALIICFLICCFSGCGTQPPSFHQIESLYLQNKSDFSTVSTYLVNIQAEWALIETDTGKIIIDFNDQKISDSLVLESLHHLWKTGCFSIYMNRADNSICFELWRTGIVGDADAGLLYAIEIDEKKLPTTQYLTELQPLQTTAWYYYVADYEEWRNHRQTTCDAR